MDAKVTTKLTWSSKLVSTDFMNKAMDGLYELGQEIKTLSQERCPVDTGTLRNSCTISRDSDSVTIGYGGAASSYAIRQHEVLNYYHSVGQAKYLESAFDELKGLSSVYIAKHLKV